MKWSLKKKMAKSQYLVIDLFAGPGGLGEGFASFTINGKNVFRTLASIECDPFAHRTLLLRHFFRSFGPHKAPREYYDYLSGKTNWENLNLIYPEQWSEAHDSALKIVLGEATHEEIKRTVANKLKGHNKWVLVGGRLARHIL